MIWTVGCIAWLSAAVLMTVAWLIYLRLNNPGIVDCFWSICIATAGLIFTLQAPINAIKVISLGLLLLWCLRLAGFLLITRILPHHIDPRYLKLSESWQLKKSLGFWLNYQLQALFALVLAMPFIWINSLNTLQWWHIVGLVLTAIGIFGESIADMQLQLFKCNQSGDVCDVGLWAYSRHPNYFFEWLVWLGFGITALHTAWSWLALISPLFILFIFLKITGPMTERGSIERKGRAYLDYQQRTSMFIPWRPKT